MDWIRYRIEDAKATRATKLDLGAGFSPDFDSEDRLRELPSDILAMDWLEDLDLSGHLLGALPKEIGALRHLRHLNLAWNPSLHLGAELAELPALEALDLSWTGRIELAAIPWTELKGLRTLSLPPTDNDEVPEALRDLASLRSLHCYGATAPDWLADLPLENLDVGEVANLDRLPATLLSLSISVKTDRLAGLARLSRLHSLSLSLSDGAPFKLPPALAELPDLMRLSIFGGGSSNLLGAPLLSQLLKLRSLSLHGVHVLPADLAPLWQLPLETLNLSNMAFEGFPEELCRNSALRHLSLRGTGLTDIPSALGDLGQLEHIDFSENPLGCVPLPLRYLKKLTSLWLGECGITTLPAELGDLAELRQLYLFNNPLNHLPEWLGRLSKLEALNLSSCGITALPDSLSRLARLENLYVNETKITHLPAGLTRLRRLKPIPFYHVPLEEPPPEIVARGWAAIQHWTYALTTEPETPEAETRLYEAKLLLVGEGDVGKTSLARRLKDPKAPIGDVKTTKGIVIDQWRIKTQKSADFTVNLWDFGGQEIYHSTHQFFLTERSAYLLVWDARREDRAGGFEYWLNVIRTLGGASPVLVVLNKCDERTEEPEQGEKELRRRFPNIAGFLQVSATKGTGMDELRTAIAEAVAGLRHVGIPWPPAWTRLRRRLEADLRDTISRDEYMDICREEGVNRDSADTLSGYLHDLGVILHFRDDPNLRDLVILKPEWGTDAVYKVLDTASVKKRKGRFGPADLGTIWDKTRHPRDKHPVLLALMARFELCFPLADSDGYIAPGLLTKNAPEEKWDDSDALLFEYRYDFMPAGIITRFICRAHALIDGRLYWRGGVFLARDGGRARIMGGDRRVMIAIKGGRPTEFLAVIRAEFDHIHRSLNNLAPRQMLSCCCEQCAGSATPHFFAFDEVRGAEGKIATMPCMKSYRQVPIANLLRIMGRSDLDPRDRDPASGMRGTPVAEAKTSALPKKPEQPKKHSLWEWLVVLLLLLAALSVVAYGLPAEKATPVIAAAAGILVVLAGLYFFSQGRIKPSELMKMLSLGLAGLRKK